MKFAGIKFEGFRCHSTTSALGLIGVLTLLSWAAGCGGDSASVLPPAIAVAITPGAAQTIDQAQTQNFTAIVSNDASNKGVTWTLTQGGVSCSPTCGTISPTSTANGSPTTYTAPATVPSPPTVTITATSVSDTSKSSSAAVTVRAVSVSVSPASANVPVNTTQQFTATVMFDVTNSGVTWTLAQGGTPCSPGCGTLDSPTVNPVIYAAPANTPAGNLTVTITATSVADTSKSGSATITMTATTVNDVVLMGQYAFLLNGFDAKGAVAIAGSFAADGNGNITGGVEDINRPTGVGASVTITGGSFSVFKDNRGTLTLTTALGTSNFRFALGGFSAPDVATKLRIIEFDTSGTRVAGFGELQDPTAFSVAQVSGDFAFGGSGDGLGGRFGLAGRFTAVGGNITDGQFDANGHIGGGLGGASVWEGITGSYTILAPNGRGTLQLIVPIPFVGGSFTLNFSLYAVSSHELLFISTDDRTTTSEPMSSGEILAQSASSVFSQASLNGASVFSSAGAPSSGGADVQAGLMTFNGNGAFTLSADENNRGTVTSRTSSGTYDVQPDGLGRVTTSATTGVTPTLYLVTENQAFMVFNDTFVTTGFFESQSAGPFTNSFLPEGFYTLGTTTPATVNVTDFSGQLFSNGSGGCSAILDEAAPTGLSPDDTWSCNFSVQASPNNGRGTLTLTNDISGSSSLFVFYIVSPFSPFRAPKVVLIDMTDGRTDPTISVAE